MRRIAVLNQKGGVGKTTTVASLAAALHRMGKRVLLIDLDPQAHLSLHFGLEVADDQPSMYDLLVSGTPLSEVLVRRADGPALVPADIDLAAAEAELISVTGRELVLREALDGVDADYDVMLVDCPPSLGVLTINALSAVHEVIIPLQGHFLSLHGLSKLLDTVTLVRQRVNSQLTVAGLVLCMHDKATRLATEVADDLTGFLVAARGEPVAWANARLYHTFIRRNIKLAEASSFGQTIFDYAPRSNGATDYARLAAEILGEDFGPEVRAGETTARQEESAADAERTVPVAGESPAPPLGQRAKDRDKGERRLSDADAGIEAPPDGPLPPTEQALPADDSGTPRSCEPIQAVTRSAIEEPERIGEPIAR